MLTTNTTVNVTCGFADPWELMVTFSAYVFGARPASTVGSTPRLMDWGVVPTVEGEIVRKLGLPKDGLTPIEKLMGVLELPS